MLTCFTHSVAREQNCFLPSKSAPLFVNPTKTFYSTLIGYLQKWSRMTIAAVLDFHRDIEHSLKYMIGHVEHDVIDSYPYFENAANKFRSEIRISRSQEVSTLCRHIHPFYFEWVRYKRTEAMMSYQFFCLIGTIFTLLKTVFLKIYKHSFHRIFLVIS